MFFSTLFIYFLGMAIIFGSVLMLNRKYCWITQEDVNLEGDEFPTGFLILALLLYPFTICVIVSVTFIIWGRNRIIASLPKKKDTNTK
jgi:hypothetical protein